MTSLPPSSSPILSCRRHVRIRQRSSTKLAVPLSRWLLAATILVCAAGGIRFLVDEYRSSRRVPRRMPNGLAVVADVPTPSAVLCDAPAPRPAVADGASLLPADPDRKSVFVLANGLLLAQFPTNAPTPSSNDFSAPPVTPARNLRPPSAPSARVAVPEHFDPAPHALLTVAPAIASGFPTHPGLPVSAPASGVPVVPEPTVPQKAIAASISVSPRFTDAAGQNLIVDAANGNSPYAVTSDDTFLGMVVGNTSTGVVNHSAGTLTVSSGLTVGYGSNSSGTYNLSGTGRLSTGPVTIGFQGAATFTQSGVSTFSVAPGSLLYLGSSPGGSGTYNLNGGTLTVSTVTGNSGTSTFNLNGGTLQAARGGNTFLQGLTTANVQAGGAIIDTQAYGVTIAQNLQHDTTVGAPALDGGLAKQAGSGTLSLSGANTFTGPTTINAGTLNLLNPLALQDSTLNLSNAAGSGTLTFDSTETSKAFTVGGLAGNGHLALADNASTPAAVTLSVGNNGTSTTYSGSLSGAGGLTKIGVGTLTLTGANTYTGNTTVAAGTLAIPTGGSITGDTLLVGAAGSPGAALVISGTSSVSAGGGFSSIDGTAANPSSVTLGDAGRLSAGNLFVGENGTGNFVQNGGSLVIAADLAVALNPGSSGSFTLNAGNVSATILSVGNYGAGTFTQNGGTVNATNGIGRLNVGANGNGVGSYVLNNGTLTTMSTLVSADAGASTFSQEGGLHVTGGLGLAADNAAANGTYNLDGGILRPGMVAPGEPFLNNQVFGTSTFNFNGGMLQAGANNASFFQGLTTANVQAGGAIIDTNGFNVTMAQSLVHEAALVSSADGGLVKNGTGTLTLSGVNTYTGGTVVHVGTLAVAVNGGLGEGNTTLDDGATLTLDVGVTAAHNASLGTTLTLASATTSVVDLAGNGVQDTVATLIIAGVAEPAGTYGAPGSGATYTNVTDFVGTGELSVVPEPSTWALVGMSASLLGFMALRRRAARG